MVQKRKIAMVYQWFVNYPSMTVYENIATPLKAVRPKLAAVEIDCRVKDTAALLKIDSLMDHYPSEISGGQQQRLAIARAMVKKADYIFLDEPRPIWITSCRKSCASNSRIFSSKKNGARLYLRPHSPSKRFLSPRTSDF